MQMQSPRLDLTGGRDKAEFNTPDNWRPDVSHVRSADHTLSRGERLFAARARLYEGDECALGSRIAMNQTSDDAQAERGKRRNGAELFLKRSTLHEGDGNLTAEVQFKIAPLRCA